MADKFSDGGGGNIYNLTFRAGGVCTGIDHMATTPEDALLDPVVFVRHFNESYQQYQLIAKVDCYVAVEMQELQAIEKYSISIMVGGGIQVQGMVSPYQPSVDNETQTAVFKVTYLSGTNDDSIRFLFEIGKK